MGFQQAGIRASSDPIEIHHLGCEDYAAMWQRQADLAAARARGEIADQLLLLEHPSTYTAGKRTQPEDRPAGDTPVVDVDRGGRITWHGPGQLVAYPIIALANPIDVVDYVRRLEQALMQTCADAGLTGTCRIDGRSGVWLRGTGSDGSQGAASNTGTATGSNPGGRAIDRKIAAIGIRVTRGVAMHGIALNCDNSLAAYETIVPCGLADAGVTSLTAELGHRVGVAGVRKNLAQNIEAALDGTLPVEQTAPQQQ
ncbi:lipoyl(octanoyl) transferase LipB [Corynebacterium heidelbergense]|uniref:Octanoyltransferase n=1 Tax=Corynebacterium heidelbergense TaxID=2055947 RepID=A0A364VD37_9CORY|nr:lipoyl(octanoyl) transferase LipB [Corynebacterium heidelbergense]RAV34563.1 lipoate-protein ligase B [Corynebacterium heidelbergense]WCZ36326.1 Octanoyltransferase [Corynebacterium heidelbergense]